MEVMLRQLYQDKASEPDTLGILIVEKDAGFDSITDGQDVILLIIKEKGTSPWFVRHYEYLDKTVSMNIIDEERLFQWMISGANRRFIDWVFNGKVLFDRNEYVYYMKKRINDFPFEERQQKLGIEFSKLIRRYEKGKALYQSENYYDAFNHILHALHHQARLSVIERGFYPEITVWDQVKHIEPETFKLYQELLMGQETIEKRIELVLLANEFAITSKAQLGSMHILKIMNTSMDPWSISELMEHPELKEYSIDLELLVSFLVQKGAIEVIHNETKAKGIYHRLYECR
ncbi:nucleotidyltransferase-like protein [Alkalihalobacterium chitinilyticum]|uniref:Nucleotidyltransferase-like protein n=1 Tax=Alkalihalobacterium chitinilyticum TaxID=2980103 RepID=A0ABT5VI03_9BACI|nr:nucleotidyltransferase-like protein [Alkalihalobacterium chitinilyticum]MDE5414885.1 nucleotidyltransferase-like protein [Alkalihalobacterium chitinilyticum]